MYQKYDKKRQYLLSLNLQFLIFIVIQNLTFLKSYLKNAPNT